MKTYCVTYHETYVRTYEIEANTPEEAEEILRERIGDGTENAPEECENSWCDVQELKGVWPLIGIWKYFCMPIERLNRTLYNKKGIDNMKDVRMKITTGTW